MIDKLFLRFADLPTRPASFSSMRSLTDFRYESAYEVEYASPMTGELLRYVLKTEPKFSTPYLTRLELNPSRLTSFEELSGLVTALGFTMTSGEVVRIDHCADIPDSFPAVLRGLYAFRKRALRTYSSGLPTGCYFGKRPEELSVYQKQMANGDLHTRIELQQHTRKCEIRYASDLPRLLEWSPFSFLRHYTLKIESEVPRQNRSYARIENQLLVSDFQTITAESRRDRNFQRDVLPLFRETDLIARATATYRSNLRAFLSGQWTDPTTSLNRSVD